MTEVKQIAYCPALFLAAPSSNSGKTTITCALARLYKNQGKKIRVFKCGPDYLDPQILEQASGQPAEQLDMWMAGDEYCQQMLYKAALTSDLIIIEGAMGLFDGDPSSADLAARFNIPVLLILDVKGMAQTAAAIAVGLANFREDFTVAGMIANNCSTQRHTELIRDSLPENLPLFANFPKDEKFALPERHLGLVQAHEVTEELESRFEAGAQALAGTSLLEHLQCLEPVAFDAVESDSEEAKELQFIATQPLANTRIAIAKDDAFSFVYSANVQLLQALGAECIFFSPLTDKQLPCVDSVWLPGGYPELHAASLSTNYSMLDDLRAFYASGRSIFAECGGFLYCLETLTDLDDQDFPMLGLLDGVGVMRGKRGCQGMQSLDLPEGLMRGHAHHRSRADVNIEPMAYGIRQRHPAAGEAIYRSKGLTASYLHGFFPSNSAAVVALFQSDSIVKAQTKNQEGFVC